METLKIVIPRNDAEIYAHPISTLTLSDAGIEAIVSYLISIENKGGGLNATRGQTEAVA